MTFQIKILGSNSAIPAYGRNHTSQVLTVVNKHYLIDCGEGTQLQIARYKARLQKIDNIFISHLHGDHYLGLIGVLSSMHLQGRQKELNIFGPPGLSEIISVQLRYSQTVLNYLVNFTELNSYDFYKIHEDKYLEVYNIPLQHRIDCSGFLFKEKKKPRRINKDKLPEDFPIRNLVKLKKGEDIYDDEGKILYENSSLTLPPRKSRSYAYFSDTKFDEQLAEYIKGVDILYHETTFLDENAYWAEKTFHSTTKQAARMAKLAKADKLLIGHFSARYKDLNPFLNEAQEEFKNSELALEGKIFEVKE